MMRHSSVPHFMLRDLMWLMVVLGILFAQHASVDKLRARLEAKMFAIEKRYVAELRRLETSRAESEKQHREAVKNLAERFRKLADKNAANVSDLLEINVNRSVFENRIRELNCLTGRACVLKYDESLELWIVDVGHADGHYSIKGRSLSETIGDALSRVRYGPENSADRDSP